MKPIIVIVAKLHICYTQVMCGKFKITGRCMKSIGMFVTRDVHRIDFACLISNLLSFVLCGSGYLFIAQLRKVTAIRIDNKRV